jgi:multidrug resistance efflux pump
MMSERMSRQEWERLKVEDFERLEADLAQAQARANALAIENAELRAALEPFAAIRFKGEAEERASALLAADSAQRGAELLAAADAMREALVRLTPGPHIAAMSGPESEGVRALKMWDRAQADLRGGRGQEGGEAT